MKMRWLGFQTFIRHKRTMVKVSCLYDCQCFSLSIFRSQRTRLNIGLYCSRDDLAVCPSCQMIHVRSPSCPGHLPSLKCPNKWVVSESFGFPKMRLQLCLSLNPCFADLRAVCTVHRSHRGVGTPNLARPDNESSALYLLGGLPLLWCRQKVSGQLAGFSAVMLVTRVEEKHSDPAGISGK